MKSFRVSGMPYRMDKDFRRTVVRSLFPGGDPLPATGDDEDIAEPDFTIRELSQATSKLKTGKAYGPDGIPPEAVKLLINEVPQMTLKVVNRQINNKAFPSAWKESRLVLLPKPGRPLDSADAYRPLCLVNAMAKVYEHLLKIRIEEQINASGGLAPNQYGFTKGRKAEVRWTQ